ncbi:PIG-L family deacetylase [Deefgea piscis]|uniref:PIG-L family deacetylase n=1 Tax=Deefgea piscis TaxID=2739061 RepID=A0A6M8SUS5_9NEIS|nr:PIG-L deacetylase family protein [Deefgea piscis]QKJ67894.1 PIG-L family deacetylase [Deefgea piscis]
MKNKVLVIAAHPDDEILGCGATIAKHISDGDEVHVAILAQGLLSREDEENISLSVLYEAAHKANLILGVSSLHLHDFPDNQMDSIPRLQVAKKIEGLLNLVKPNMVYTHWVGDVNIDHQRIHEAAIIACRPYPGQSVKKLLFFEIASSTEWQLPSSAPMFNPNWFVDSTLHLKTKIEALECYFSELREWPHPRSVKAITHMAHWRGATVGVDSAEAFILGRGIH